MSIELVMPPNHLILCCPLLFPPSIFPIIRVFSSELTLYIRWPKHWSFSFSITSSNEYSALISFRIDWFDLLAVQRILKSSLAPQFESNSLVFSPLYSPTLTFVCDYWKKHSFAYTDLCLALVLIVGSSEVSNRLATWVLFLLSVFVAVINNSHFYTIQKSCTTWKGYLLFV